MAEMEINANQQLKFEFDKITEAGQKLEPCYGPGYTGMINLGNRCERWTVCCCAMLTDLHQARPAILSMPALLL
jgi:ubiquitin carboxyl-terminal hydrolase 5/13